MWCNMLTRTVQILYNTASWKFRTFGGLMGMSLDMTFLKSFEWATSRPLWHHWTDDYGEDWGEPSRKSPYLRLVSSRSYLQFSKINFYQLSRNLMEIKLIHESCFESEYVCLSRQRATGAPHRNVHVHFLEYSLFRWRLPNPSARAHRSMVALCCIHQVVCCFFPPLFWCFKVIFTQAAVSLGF